MDVKIIGKSVVPDRIVLYENDLGAKNLVFSSSKINDGVNLEVLNAYLEVEREEGVSDRFILDKTLVDDIIYFVLPINLALTETADLLSSQVVFENQEKTLSYRSKVFYIEVKNSIDGVSSYEQIAPTVLSQLETKMDKAVKDCESMKGEIEVAKEEFERNIEETSSKIKDEVISQINDSTVDSELSLDSENPVQNKVITEALATKITTPEAYPGLPSVISMTENGVIGRRSVANSPSKICNGSIASYQNYGTSNIVPSVRLWTGTPLYDGEAANKKYVDESKDAKLYKHTITANSIYGPVIIHFYSLNSQNDYVGSDEYGISIDATKVLSQPYLTIPDDGMSGGTTFTFELGPANHYPDRPAYRLVGMDYELTEVEEEIVGV